MADDDMPDVPGLDEYVLVEFAANGQRKPMTRAKYDLMVASGSEGLRLLEDVPVSPSVEPGSEVTAAMRRESERLRDGDPDFVPDAHPIDDGHDGATADETGPEPDGAAPTAPAADGDAPAAAEKTTKSGGGRRASTSGEEQS